jgi:hypothetical protein
VQWLAGLLGRAATFPHGNLMPKGPLSTHLQPPDQLEPGVTAAVERVAEQTDSIPNIGPNIAAGPLAGLASAAVANSGGGLMSAQNGMSALDDEAYCY